MANSNYIPVSDRRLTGRPTQITREDLFEAAIALTGPHRSISTLSLREIARQAGIAPNSFYRHFRDVDELVVALIEQSGQTLRDIVGRARREVGTGKGIVRSSVELFFGQLQADRPFLHILLREGRAGSPAFKTAVERQLTYFEDELELDLVRLSTQEGVPLARPAEVATAITRLVFAMGSVALDTPAEALPSLIERLVVMVHMIIRGAQDLARPDRED